MFKQIRFMLAAALASAGAVLGTAQDFGRPSSIILPDLFGSDIILGQRRGRLETGSIHRHGGAVAHRKWKRARASGRR